MRIWIWRQFDTRRSSVGSNTTSLLLIDFTESRSSPLLTPIAVDINLRMHCRFSLQFRPLSVVGVSIVGVEGGKDSVEVMDLLQ